MNAAGGHPPAGSIVLEPVFLIALLTSAVATLLLSRWADRAGWTDGGADAPARKLQGRPVPLVGGAAILSGLFLILAGLAPTSPALTGFHFASGLDRATDRRVCLALVLAFGVGLVDDLKPTGLRPAWKACGQMAAGVLLVASGALEGAQASPAAALAWILAAVLAQNAMNTFDNADGAATALALCGVALPAPLLAAPLLGFLPFNLWVRPRPDTSRAGADAGDPAPLAYLGDSGSHLLGLLLVVNPATRLVLWLPLLDLARLSYLRWRHGSRPWIGDRRHLAHRLMAAGLSPTPVVLVMLLIAVPAILVPALRSGGMLDDLEGVEGLLWIATGLGLSTLLFALAVRLTPDIP